MTWTLPEPMLTTPVASPDLPPGSAAEPKWDGSPDASDVSQKVKEPYNSSVLPYRKRPIR